MISKRRNLQTRIEQLRKRTTQSNKITLTKSLYARKQYTTQTTKTQLNNKQIVAYIPPQEINKPEHDTYEKWKHITKLQHIHNQIQNGRGKDSEIE